MFPVFKYTLKKYAVAKSTWIITALSVIISGVIGGYLPFSLINTSHSDAYQTYGIISTVIVSSITAMLSIFISIFSGFKAASMYKDEVEDGTFLVLLSKPHTRRQIIFGKWLALQAISLIYTFITILAFIIFVSVFDSGDEIHGLAENGISTLSSKIFEIGGIMWAILIVMSLIFSSIAILLSTKLSVGGTVGAAISMGIIIPVSSLIAIFTRTVPYEKLYNPEPSKLQITLQGAKRAIESEPTIPDVERKVIQDIIDGATKDLGDFTDAITKSPISIYNLGISTDDTDTFRAAWVIDFNFQVKRLAAIAAEKATPAIVKAILDDEHKINLGPDVSHTSTPVMAKDDQFHLKAVDTNYDNPVPSEITRAIMNVLGEYVPMDSKTHAAPGSFWRIAQIGHDLKNKIETAMNLPIDAKFQNLLKNLHRTFSDMQDPIEWLIHHHDMDKAYNNISPRLPLPTSEQIDAMYNAVYPSTSTIMIGSKKHRVPFELSKVLGDHEWILAKMIAIANHKENSLVKIESVEYVNKFTILWIYLLIAFTLVPISYFVVKKQDFR